MRILSIYSSIFFFFNDPPTTEIYTLSLHDALPISPFPAEVLHELGRQLDGIPLDTAYSGHAQIVDSRERSEEHTSELQSHHDLVCRLLLEKKKNKNNKSPFHSKGNTNTLYNHIHGA